MRAKTPDRAVYEEVRENWDRIAKPLNGLGRFEEMVCRIGAIQGTADVRIDRRAVLLLCADNGIVEEGVTQTGQEVTREVASWMGRGVSSVCRMAEKAGIDTIPVDLGIRMEGTPAGVLDRKVRQGTENFLKKTAMTEEECRQAIETGIGLVRMCSEQGYQILATGEMGIGNTTTSAVLAAAFLQVPAAEVTGRGSGLSSEGLDRKRQIVREALERYDACRRAEETDADFAFRMLRCAGGLDIAGLTGVFMGAAQYRMPVVLDGFITSVAALAAERMMPGTKEYLLASHIGREPGMRKILEQLGLRAVIDGDLALGEGTGAVMLFPLLDMTLSLYRNGLKFDETAVEQYEHFEDPEETPAELSREDGAETC